MKLLADIQGTIVVDFYPQGADEDTAKRSATRSTFSKKEQSKRVASKDQALIAKMTAERDAERKRYEAQVKLAKDNGLHFCKETAAGGGACTKGPFLTATGLERHKCHFADRATTADAFQSMFPDELQGNRASVRLVAAGRAGAEQEVVAKNRSYFCFTLSDDNSQDMSHLLVHKLAAFAQRQRIPELATLVQYICKTDGAGCYASAISKLAVRVLHLVAPDKWPRCLELLQSIAGDGKAGPDRFHAEVGAQLRRQLRQGCDQTNAHENATALTKAGGMKGAFISVVTVERSEALARYHKLKFKDPGPPVAKGTKKKRQKKRKADAIPVRRVDDGTFNGSGVVDTLALRAWSKHSGKFHRKQPPVATTAVGANFVEGCFNEGANGGTKVRASAVVDRMVAAIDMHGLPLFGPESLGGPVWAISKVTSKYGMLFSNQKGAAALVNNASHIDTMTAAKCGCGKAKHASLIQVGVSTLGDLLDLADLDDEQLEDKICDAHLKMKDVHNWINHLQRIRSGE